MDEGEHIKEVYAHFGLAVYLAQVLEHGIVNALVYTDLVPRRSGHVRSREEWAAEYDAFVGRQFEGTLGRLINALKQHVPVPTSLECTLQNALKTRNFFAHCLFRERAVEFMSFEGREGMLREIEEAQGLFKRADAELESVIRPFRLKIGFTDERLRTAHEEFRREVGLDCGTG